MPPLTDLAIRKTRPKARPTKLFDGGGLYLYVTPSGGRLWRQKYRWLGKEKTLSHGPYPAVPLADARHRRDGAQRLLAAGIGLGAHKKASKDAAIEQAAYRIWPSLRDPSPVSINGCALRSCT